MGQGRTSLCRLEQTGRDRQHGVEPTLVGNERRSSLVMVSVAFQSDNRDKFCSSSRNHLES